MTRARLGGVVAGMLLLLACSVGTSAGDGRPSGSPESTDAATRAEAMDLLRSGTEFIDQTSFRVDTDIAGQVTTLSHVDTVGKRATITISAAGRVVEIRLIDDEIYLKSEADLPGVGHRWMVLDPTRVPPDFAVGFAPGKNDPGGSARLIDAVVTARAAAPYVTGTIDVTRMRAGNGINFQPGPGETFPDSAGSHPFRATLDADGRLVSFVMPAANGIPDASLRYSAFGTAVEVIRPEGATAAPAALYRQLGLRG
ncbi:hypothetical protein [Micromonospora avicenniae]|nr:hypothetical protein [Micromonospora avicenniae]